MKNYILLVLAFSGIILTLLGAFLKITHINIAFLTGNSALAIALLITFIVWIFVFFDIFNSKSKTSTWYFFAMILFPNITPVIYLINKSRN